MTVNLIQKGSKEFQKILDAVTRELVTWQESPKGAFITTPLTYPGGAAVVVQVSESEKDFFFVSDFGMGLEEAEAMGATPQTFSRYAHAIAEASGIRFDNHSFFVVEASKAQLAGAIVAVANASQASVVHTAFRMADKTEQTDSLLFERLAFVFKGRGAQVLQTHVMGHSTTSWRVDALVRIGPKLSVFEGVRNHRMSVAYASMKFNDISLNDNAPKCYAVVHNKPAFGTLINVLSQSGASVIEDTIADSKFIELAEAA